MKKAYKLLVLGILTFFLAANLAPVLNANDTADPYENVDFDLTFTVPQIQQVQIGNEIFDRVSINGLSNTGDFNKPCLPFKSVKILLPYGKTIDEIFVTNSEKVSLGYDYNVEIGQHLFPLTQSQNEIEYVAGNIDTIYPGNLYSIVGIHKFRGLPILFVNLYPVQYNMGDGEVFYYDQINLQVTTKESSNFNSLRNKPRDLDIVEDMVDNPYCVNSYQDLGSTSIEDTYTYIIITNQALSTPINRDYDFHDLKQSKIDKGLTAEIFTVEEIINNPDYDVNGPWGDNNPSNPYYQYPIIGDIEEFNDNQSQIRNFIRHACFEYGTDFVLLAGDADFGDPAQNIVPVRCLYSNETGLPLGDDWFEEDDIPTDVYYACLDGNFNYDGDNRWGEDEIGNNLTNIDEADLLSDVWVARACVDSEEEVSNFVMKIISYENNNNSYLKDILLVGEHLGFPGVSEWGGNYKDLVIPYISEDYNIETLYDRDLPEFWTKYDMMDILNTETPHVINHDGHSYYGYNMRMGNNDVDSLTNSNYFFVYSHGCMAGGFDNPDGYDCIAEHYTVKTQYAAIGGIWNARFGLGSNNTLDSPSGAYDISFIKALFVEEIGEMGRASHWSKEDNIPRILENGMRWCYYQTNLFGDPEVSYFNHASSNPPAKPDTPEGPTNGKTGVVYTFCTSTTDPDGDDVYYWFDWGDETNSGWIGPYPSGMLVCANHSWEQRGSYEIKVKARDMYAATSEWSDPLPISIPRNRISSYPLLIELLENLILRFPILEKIFSQFIIN